MIDQKLKTLRIIVLGCPSYTDSRALSALLFVVLTDTRELYTCHVRQNSLIRDPLVERARMVTVRPSEPSFGIPSKHQVYHW